MFLPYACTLLSIQGCPPFQATGFLPRIGPMTGQKILFFFLFFFLDDIFFPTCSYGPTLSRLVLLSAVSERR